MKKLLISFLVLGASLAFAGETKIGLHLRSHHFSDGPRGKWWEPDYQYNNVNPGVYAYHDGWTAGVFYNSERRVSVYGGYTFESPQWNKLSVAATVGLISGYGSSKTIYPMLIPSVAWEHGFLGRGSTLRMMFMPKAAKNGSAALHLTHEWKF